MDRAPANLQVTVIAISVLLVVGGLLWFGTGSGHDEPVVALPQEPAEDRGSITVHVSGEVVDPGVVSVALGSRVADVVAAAGGATVEADLAAVNLASEVRDGEHVAIPGYGDVAIGRMAPPGVDLNRADALAMEQLPGVGPVLAARIVAHRDEHGPFMTVEDLLDIPGIGEAKLDGMRDAIAVP